MQWVDIANVRRSSFKEVGMRSRPLEYDLILVQLINEQPIRFNMTFSATDMVSDQLMVPMQRIKLLALDQCPSNEFELIKVLFSLLCPLDVPLELSGVDRGSHSDPQLPEHIIGVFTNDEVFAGIGTFEYLSRGDIRNDHVEREPLS
jgi:hypothetical protein